MPFTFGDHVKELRNNFPEVSPNDADAIVWQAIKDVFSDAQWSIAIGQSMLQTEAMYDTGTILLTNGSTSVVLTGGTWVTSWSTAPSSRRIIAGGFSEDYGITITSGTTGTLSSPWPHDTDPDGTYQMFRETYVLPSDCDESQLIAVLDTARTSSIRVKDFGYFTRRKVEDGFTGPGQPEIATAVTMTTAGLAQLRFHPAPSEVEVYPIYYFRKPTRPTGPSSLILPAFPERYEDLIWRRALWNAAVHSRYKREDWMDYQQQYWDRHFEALSNLDGGPVITRIIAGTEVRSRMDVDEYTNFRVRM